MDFARMWEFWRMALQKAFEASIPQRKLKRTEAPARIQDVPKSDTFPHLLRGHVLGCTPSEVQL